MPGRFVYIDSLRGIASVIVVIFHYHHFYLTDYSGRPGIPQTAIFPYADVLKWAYDHGHFAVQLFWVISGFVFYHIYTNKKTSIFHFSVHRFARLYPLHFLTLVVVAIIQYLSLRFTGHWQIYGNNDAFHFFLQTIFASNWLEYSHGLSFNGPIWSVSLEVVTYGIFFISLFAIKNHPMLTAALMLTLSWSISSFEQLNFWIFSRGVFVCVGYFFIGGIVYCFYKGVSGSNGKLIGLLVIGLCLSVMAFVKDWNLPKVALSSATLVLLSASFDNWFKTSSALLKTLGDSSYSLYLVHVPIQMLCLTIADVVFHGDRSFASSSLTLPIYLSISLVVANYAYVYFEIPSGKWIKNGLLNRHSHEKLTGVKSRVFS